MKIQWEIVYIRCTDHLDLKKKNFEFVECTNSSKFDGKSMNVPNRETSLENCVYKM